MYQQRREIIVPIFYDFRTNIFAAPSHQPVPSTHLPSLFPPTLPACEEQRPWPHLAHSTTTSVFSVVFSGMAGCRGCWLDTEGGSSPEDTTRTVIGAVDHRGGVPPSTALTRTSKILVLACGRVETGRYNISNDSSSSSS
ncbi:hypothetical protein E2C01_093647 [Portunus trituberculatus]|uniref:Uncharacterized protein n=1 Tax=Portunus trituberculatus TaxID=210409 RepID=A0A5B7K108_PORTR|nr:hypothetical protein [Portunus trituberculatus]